MTTGCSQQDFGFFKDEWRRYATSAGTQNDTLLGGQLLQCAETGLRKTLQNTDKMTTITVTELMDEIKKATLEKQTTLLNKLMEAKQECDEPIRTFMARLRGHANVYNLPHECNNTHHSFIFLNMWTFLQLL